MKTHFNNSGQPLCLTYHVNESALVGDWERVTCLYCHAIIERKSIADWTLNISLQKVANIVNTIHIPDKNLYPLLLYLGNLSIERARSLLYFTIVCKKNSLVSISRMVRLSKMRRDINETCGIKNPITPLGFSGFLSRLFDHPEVVQKTPIISIKWLSEVSSTYRWGLSAPKRISTKARRSKRSWRLH